MSFMEILPLPCLLLPFLVFTSLFIPLVLSSIFSEYSLYSLSIASLVTRFLRDCHRLSTTFLPRAGSGPSTYGSCTSPTPGSAAEKIIATPAFAVPPRPTINAKIDTPMSVPTTVPPPPTFPRKAHYHRYQQATVTPSVTRRPGGQWLEICRSSLMTANPRSMVGISGAHVIAAARVK
jgi:hypothetical protein